MENTVNEVVEMTEETMENAGSKLADFKPEGKWIAVGAIGTTLVIGAGLSIKKLIDKKKASKESVGETSKKSLLERLPKIHLGKKPKETTEETTEDKSEEE